LFQPNPRVLSVSAFFLCSNIISKTFPLASLLRAETHACDP